MLYINSKERADITIFKGYIYNYLKENKLKYSDQRERVLKMLYEQNYPVSVDFLVKKLNEGRSGIGHATVSRHLKFFQKLDLLIITYKTKNSYLLKKDFEDIHSEYREKNLELSDLKSIIESGNYGVCYEPIIKLSDMSVYGYEALSRFRYKEKFLSPESFFKVIHKDIDTFFSVETLLKIFQIKHRVKGKKLFLNFDPDICLEDAKIASWLDLLEPQENIVIEIIENSDEERVVNIEYFMKWLKEFNLPFAYDDYGKPNSLFFPALLEKSAYLKLDIHFIQTIRKNPAYSEMLQGIVKFAKQRGQYTVLEGVESREDLAIAQKVGVDFVQGYLFKEQFIQVFNQ